MIKAIATASFVHGAQTLKRGEEAEFTPPTFTALAAHGLVREKPAQTEQAEAVPARTQRAARTPSNKKAPDLQNQAEQGAATAADTTRVEASDPALAAPEENAAAATSTDSVDADKS